MSCTRVVASKISGGGNVDVKWKPKPKSRLELGVETHPSAVSESLPEKTELSVCLPECSRKCPRNSEGNGPAYEY